MKLRHLDDKDLFGYFRDISSQATITPFTDIEYKKYDAKNVRTLKAYQKAIGAYIGCIQELRSRGYTLIEIMEILK